MDPLQPLENTLNSLQSRRTILSRAERLKARAERSQTFKNFYNKNPPIAANNFSPGRRVLLISAKKKVPALIPGETLEEKEEDDEYEEKEEELEVVSSVIKRHGVERSQSKFSDNSCDQPKEIYQETTKLNSTPVNNNNIELPEKAKGAIVSSFKKRIEGSELKSTSNEAHTQARVVPVHRISRFCVDPSVYPDGPGTLSQGASPFYGHPPVGGLRRFALPVNFFPGDTRTFACLRQFHVSPYMYPDSKGIDKVTSCKLKKFSVDSNIFPSKGAHGNVSFKSFSVNTSSFPTNSVDKKVDFRPFSISPNSFPIGNADSSVGVKPFSVDPITFPPQHIRSVVSEHLSKFSISTEYYPPMVERSKTEELAASNFPKFSINPSSFPVFAKSSKESTIQNFAVSPCNFPDMVNEDERKPLRAFAVDVDTFPTHIGNESASIRRYLIDPTVFPMKKEEWTSAPGYKTKWKTIGKADASVGGNKVTGSSKITAHIKASIHKTGHVFWDTHAPAEGPYTFELFKRMITGLNPACLGMKVGEIREIYIPSEEAYGRKGLSVWGIKPDTDLVFVLELLKIE